jgi:putative transposase
MNDLAQSLIRFSAKILAMIVSLRHLLGWIVSAFSSREDLVLENLALRRQLLALHAQQPRRRLTALHKLFWVALRMCWSGRRQPLVLITPRTVVNWHRAGFRLYWTWVSRVRQIGGRKRVSKEVRAMIFRMVAENPTWGAPRIHSELLKLGFDVSERSVSRWIRRVPRDPHPVKRWLTFLRNHREAIAAMDVFTVPTLTFGVLYCFFVIGHDRRKILHFNVTRNPDAVWIVQQLREAWPYKEPHRFLLFDRDAKFGADVVSAVKDMGSEPIRTAFAGQGTVHFFCEHLSPVDESASNPKPKSLLQAERSLFHVGHNELARTPVWSQYGNFQPTAQPTTQPTNCDVLYDLRVFWQSPRSCKLL